MYVYIFIYLFKTDLALLGGWGVVEAVLLIFGIFERQYFFFVIGNGVDDFFDMENKKGSEFIDTGRWKFFLDLAERAVVSNF